MQEQINKFQEIIDSSERIAFFGGAGVSTESGIPDFRSAEGLFMQESGYNVAPEQIISRSFFNQHPETFFKYYFENLVHLDAKPNQTHQFLAELEKEGKQVDVITQNIDGLHQKAGSTRVHELHGSVERNTCMKCGKFFTLEALQKDENGIPRCPHDGGVVKPDVTLYEEQLDEKVIEQAYQAIQQAECLIVAGTSLSVYPAAGMIHWFNGEHFVVINQTPVDITHLNALVFQNRLSEVFTALNKK